MKLSTFTLLLFSSFLTTSLAIQSSTFWKIRREVERHIERENRLYGRLTAGVSEVENYTLPQMVDNLEFNPNPRQYNQRYWRNAAYWRSPDSPVFLYIGGESALSGGYIAGGHIVEMAKEYGALLFAVEHRYYGKSNFKDCLKGSNMHLLSSQQALADLANFVSYASKKFEITSRNKWIAYGGSYPGSLSAWFRIKYPHLVVGSVASSAPVEAQTNFEDYNNVVASSLSSPLVGGSQMCVDNIAVAFQEVDILLDEQQFEKLQSDFMSCNDISKPNDTWVFATNLAGLFMGLVQYNNMNPAYNIRLACKMITNTTTDPYDNLVYLYQLYMKKLQNCTDNSYKNFIDTVKDDVRDPEGFQMIRQWNYQSCTQFGYFQTCDRNTKCLFSKRMGIMSDLNMCQDVFGITADEVRRRVNFTNEYYGSNKPKGTNIVFVNGSIDPWHALSVLTNQTSSEVAIFIPGTAHCANMGVTKPTDPPELIKARQEVSAIVGQWLTQEQ